MVKSRNALIIQLRNSGQTKWKLRFRWRFLVTVVICHQVQIDMISRICFPLRRRIVTLSRIHTRLSHRTACDARLCKTSPVDLGSRSRRINGGKMIMILIPCSNPFIICMYTTTSEVNRMGGVVANAEGGFRFLSSELRKWAIVFLKRPFGMLQCCTSAMLCK